MHASRWTPPQLRRGVSRSLLEPVGEFRAVTGHTVCMASLTARLTKLAREPGRIPRAITRRVVPRSAFLGSDWVHLKDGSVTFRERGFVAANGPATLLARHNFELRAITRELAGIHVERSLEIGCGFGRLSHVIAEHSGSHTAVDINDEALNLARRTYKGVEFEYGSATALPVATGTIGLLVTWTVLQHIRPDDIVGACREILRVLAPEAVVLICEETAWPEASGGHTWHRTIHDYESLLSPLTLDRHSPITEIASVPGMETPGEVMVFNLRA